MFKKAIASLLLISTSLYAQRIERLIETRSVSNHEIVGAEHDASTNSLFILANVSEANGNGLLIKVNAANGDTLWSKFVAPTSQNETFKGLYKSTTALYAYGSRMHQSNQYAFVAKLNLNGDTLWTKHYRTLATTGSCSNPYVVVNGMIELPNGDLTFVGRNVNCDRAILFKTDALGAITSL